jgi:hypothetical protein
MDLEYWLRIASHGGKLVHIPQFLATARWHTEAKTLAALPHMKAELEAVRDRYRTESRFRSPRWQRMYADWLNKFYRLKRQVLKLILRRTIDFPPGTWILSKQQKQA